MRAMATGVCKSATKKMPPVLNRNDYHGINGPYLSRTGFYMKREAFYRSPTQKDLSHTATTEYAGRSKQFIASPRPYYKYKAIENDEDALDRLQQEANFWPLAPMSNRHNGIPILKSILHQILTFFNASKVSDPWFDVFTIVHASWHFQHMLEVLATGGSLRLWWNHLRILMIKSVTSYFMGCLDILMKRFGMKELNFETTSKVVVEEQVKRYQMDTFDFQAATGLLLPLTTITILNIASLVLGLRRAILETTYDTMFGQIFLSFFVVTLSYPIIEGMIIRTDKGRILIFGQPFL
ncbi:hypothetical protein IFM89_007664 [Coptis chinensis]|uniref:Uncharacterized protein n=1 Tax=Coptis chinensis TaxID=261450 RepID=A0A835HWF9_9MAGN|nr:hypothetical protein IFM89_007664 [Coptis chinensis]